MSFFKKITGLKTDDAPQDVAVKTNKRIPKKTESQETESADDFFSGDWLDNDDYEEGQLAIDVYQRPDAIIVRSTIAGVKPEDIDIVLNNDMLTIRGTRTQTENITEDDYFYQECYWGSFSRSVILPVEVQADNIDATIENGVLTITLQKAHSAKQIAVKVKE